jgi:hypothetical protein
MPPTIADFRAGGQEIKSCRRPVDMTGSMNVDEVRFGAVERAVARQGVEFHTRDISENPDVVREHGRFALEGNYHAMIGRALSNSRERFGISEVVKDDERGRGSRWSKHVGEPVAATTAAVGEIASRRPVGEGHWAAVTAMHDPEFRRIIELFDARAEIGGTYFRVAEEGFQPVDLDAVSKAPLIEVGPPFSPTTKADALEDELDARVARLVRTRATITVSPERHLQARFVRHALKSSLRLDPLPPTLRLIAGQWRLDDARVIDLLSVDVAARSLVVVEVRAPRDPRALDQAAACVEEMREWPSDVRSFFAALGNAMAATYSCGDMPETLEPGAVTGLAAWPRGRGAIDVIVCP